MIAVFVSPVTEFLLHFGRDLGFETVMLDPDSSRLAWAEWRYADQVYSVPTEEFVDRNTDVVFTDHDRDELGPTLESFLRLPARWIGVMGNPRHPGPARGRHCATGRRRLGDRSASTARSASTSVPRTPPEIAIATLAGLIADRNDKPGGFAF